MRTESIMQPLGSSAPDFDLPDTVSGQQVSLADVPSDVATVVMFLCNHCPFVVHVNDQIVALAGDYQSRDVSFVAISSNDVNEYPQDGPEQMAIQAEKVGYTFPYLYDESQEVAHAYGATCTPDLFVYDASLTLVYRGRMDGSTPGNGVVNDGAELRAALDALVAGEPVPTDQRPSMGCSIKWK